MTPPLDVPRCLVLLSGGIDSAATVHWFVSHGHPVTAVFVDYGHNAAAAEAKAAEGLASHFKIELRRCKVESRQADEPGEIFARNALLLTTGVFAVGHSEGLISFGAHAGTPYFDCSEAFVRDMDRLFADMSDGKLRLVAPFLSWRKAEVYAYFERTGVPLELTYSCEAGTQKPCGQCPSCKDRVALGIQ